MNRKLLCEFLGTFLLVMMGCGAIVLGEIWPEFFNNFIISLFFGFAVFLSIIIFGKCSGSHINPAVSLAFYLKKEMKFLTCVSYMSTQIFGAIFAAFVLKTIFPDSLHLGSTFPKVGVMKTFLLEFGMTFLLLLLIYRIAHQSTLKVGILVGLLIFLEAYFGGPLTGASMNPARSFGPMVVSGEVRYLWIYLLAPFSASFVVNLFKSKTIS